MTPRRPSIWCAVAWAALPAALLSGCASTPAGPGDEPAVNAGLDRILGDPVSGAGQAPPRTSDEIRDWLARDAQVLPSLARGEVPGAAPADARPPAANP
ncbi:MAG: hypothetical protein D6693_08135, partial [Planctomycetota bacterium]